MAGQAPESFVDMLFPARGVDLGAGFGEQVALTSPIALNVRTYEALTARARGGSRPGLIRFINQALPLGFLSGSRLVQHLNVIVDPRTTGLLGGNVAPPGPSIPMPGDAGPPDWWPLDPGTGLPVQPSRNPGDPVPPGGWGVQPTKQPHGKKPPIAFLQSNIAAYASGTDGGPPGVYTCGFPQPCQLGDLLVVAYGGFGTSLPEVRVTDTLGNVYVEAGHTTPNSGIRMRFFYAVNQFFGGNTVTVRSNFFATTTVAVLEYQNVRFFNPLDTSVTMLSQGGASVTAGPLTPNTNAEVIVAGFADFQPPFTTTYSIQSPFTQRAASGSTGTLLGLCVADHIQGAGHADPDTCVATCAPASAGTSPNIVSFIDP